MSTLCASGKNSGGIGPLRILLHLYTGDPGSALVEMALVMPIMLCMLTGIFSFSQSLYQKLQLEEGVSVGGRTLAASRGVTDPCATAVAAVYAAAPGFGVGSITFSITIDGQPAYTTSCTAAGGANNAKMPAGSNAQIVATAPCTLTIYNVKALSCALGSQITEVVQ